MSTAERKARKRIRREEGFPTASAYFKAPKRPTAHYLSKDDRRKLQKQTRLVNFIDRLRSKGKSDDEIKAELGNQS